MGARGPRPTPTSVLRMRGSWSGNLNRNEPIPEAGTPDTPDWLDEVAQSVWEQIAPQLESMRVLTRIDANALAYG